MKVRLMPLEIANQVDTEDNLLDQSKMESIYEIRALKAAIELAGLEVEITQTNDNGQIFIDSHEIWLKPNTWEEVQ